jgi:hypothetical protein
MFNEHDNFLIFKILYDYEKWYNNCMKKSSTYKIKSISSTINKTSSFINSTMTEALFVKNKKETIHKFFPIGIYNEDKYEFVYVKGTNKVILDHILKRYDIIDIFGSDSTIKKLFKATVKLSPSEHIIILCIFAIFNPAFSIIKYKPDDKNLTIYGFAQLNIKCNLDYDKFIDNMSLVRLDFLMSNKTTSKKKK